VGKGRRQTGWKEEAPGRLEKINLRYVNSGRPSSGPQDTVKNKLDRRMRGRAACPKTALETETGVVGLGIKSVSHHQKADIPRAKVFKKGSQSLKGTFRPKGASSAGGCKKKKKRGGTQTELLLSSPEPLGSA